MATMTPPKVAESHRVTSVTDVRTQSEQDKQCF